MLETVRVTGPLPVLTSAGSSCQLAPSDFVDLRYAPALLLPFEAPALIQARPDYAPACCNGFEGYFAGMWEFDLEDNDLFVDRFYTCDEVKRYVCDELSGQTMAPHIQRSPLSWRVGFVLGWLSAHALVDRAAALRGLAVLARLLDHLAFCQCSSAPSRVIAPDAQGFALDVELAR